MLKLRLEQFKTSIMRKSHFKECFKFIQKYSQIFSPCKIKLQAIHR